jgi:succinyl-CoA synthetase alpha subunit
LVILLGEIGGADEIAAAQVVKEMKKPVVSYICGMCAPKEKPMGHAGAIQSGHSDSAEFKSKVLGASGAYIAQTREEIFLIVEKLFESM